MKNEIFITIQHLKKSILRWRVFGIFIVFLLIMASSNNENIFNRQEKDDFIARININSIIENGAFSSEKLEELKKDYVKGIILDIDSPGGDVVESEKLYNFFRKLSIKKPMISAIGGMGTSGAYMIAMASDYIIAYNTSIVGSIGVIIEAFEVTDLAKKIGINLTNYKSSSLESSLNPYEKITPDVDMVISQQIDDVYDYFLNIFVERRKIKIAEAQEIANGQTYTGRQALEFGLIDKIGGEDEILDYFKTNNFNLDEIPIIDYNIYENDEKHSFFKFFFNSVSKPVKNNLKIKAIYKVN